MSDNWAAWVGQLADGKFPLRRYLGSSDHSAVFLTQFGESSPRDAAIKFLSADSIGVDLQLSRWRLAAELEHPHLLRVFASGHCTVNDFDLLYVVTDYAEENLAQVLPGRALSPGELRAVLEPTLEALTYLHSKNFLHAALKPSNILASGDSVKLSADTLLPVHDSSHPSASRTPYDPPEAAAGARSTASDVWSLGVSLVETLTQKPPVASGEDSDPAVPDSLPAPFLEIARRSLHRDPKDRCSLAEVSGLLNPKAQAAAAAVASPVSSVAASIPAAALPTPMVPPSQARPARPPRPQPSAPLPPLPKLPAARRPSASKPGYFIPLIIAAAVILLLVTLPRLLNHKAAPEVSASTASEPAAAPPSSPPPEARGSSTAALPRAKSKESASPRSDARPAPPPEELQPASEKHPVPSAPPATALPSSAPTRSAASPRGGILDQVLPDVSQKARDTIRGTVRVDVHVQVSPAGDVTDASVQASPSKYFSEKSLAAARKWVFQSPEVNGRSVPSEWLVRFEFTTSDTRAVPRQTTP